MTRYPVLRSRIPDERYGRALTTVERRDLQAVGLIIPARTRVVRVQGVDHIGALYRPVSHGFGSLDISVTLVERSRPSASS